MSFNGKLLKGDGTIPTVREGWLVGQRKKKFFSYNQSMFGYTEQKQQ